MSGSKIIDQKRLCIAIAFARCSYQLVQREWRSGLTTLAPVCFKCGYSASQFFSTSITNYPAHKARD